MAAQLLDFPGRMRHWEARLGVGFFSVPVLQAALNPPSWEPVGSGKTQAVGSPLEGHNRPFVPRDPILCAVQHHCCNPCCTCSAVPPTFLSRPLSSPFKRDTQAICEQAHHYKALGMTAKLSLAQGPSACAKWLRVNQQPRAGMAWGEPCCGVGIFG